MGNPPACFRECAVDPTASPPARPSSAIEIELPLECIVGEVVALAAIAIAVALDERRHGGLALRTKQQGADLLSQLYALRQACSSFDAIACEHGKRALRERYAQLKGKLNGGCPPFTEEMAAEMVSWPLDALHKITAAELN
jgi:hypothetical protein